MSLLALIIILISLSPIQQKHPETSNPKKVPIELWFTGDDLFSQRMQVAFYAAFEAASDFELLEENKPGNMIIRIPENVGWKEVGKRTKISYIVEFSTFDERVFMSRKGSCWDPDYATCAKQIVKHAKDAARKLPVKTSPILQSEIYNLK